MLQIDTNLLDQLAPFILIILLALMIGLFIGLLSRYIDARLDQYDNPHDREIQDRLKKYGSRDHDNQ